MAADHVDRLGDDGERGEGRGEREHRVRHAGHPGGDEQADTEPDLPGGEVTGGV